jgi:hypothetical protein
MNPEPALSRTAVLRPVENATKREPTYCPKHLGTEALPGHQHCWTCLARMSPHPANLERYRALAAGEYREPDGPDPIPLLQMGHCGKMFAVERFPVTCPRCGSVVLAGGDGQAPIVP